MASHVSEVYSPPRVTALAAEFRLIPGMALDLTVTDPDDGLPWDFSNGKKRRKAEWLIKTRRSLLLIGSPMCTAFSRLQTASFKRMTPEAVHEVLAEGRRHLEWTARLYRLQLSMGLYFLHEHPDSGTSWNEPCMTDLMKLPNVTRVTGDMCRWGMTQHDYDG